MVNMKQYVMDASASFLVKYDLHLLSWTNVLKILRVSFNLL